MPFSVGVEVEEDGRWIAEVIDLPEALAYGATRAKAVSSAEAFALRIIADRLDNGDSLPELGNVFAVVA